MIAPTAASPEAAERAFADALLDPSRPVPEGWVGAAGADASHRFAVYRNNVVVSLMAALADTFPVVRSVIGPAAFDALARWHVVAHPPRSAVLSDWGDAFPDWLDASDAAPWLPDLARLERARVRACHAADAEPLTAAALSRVLADPARLPSARPGLHPSVQVLSSPHAVVSLWAAHADDATPAPASPEGRAESAVVLRDPLDEVLVLPVSAPAAVFVEGLRRGEALGAAAMQAAIHPAALVADLAEAPPFDLAPVLALLIRHGALCAWHDPGEPPCVP